MNKFSKRLAVALMTCAAAGAAACQEQNKPEDKPAASAPAPAPTSEAAPDKTATPPAAETKSEAAATPTPPAAEPQKPADAAASTPAPAPEPEKKAEAPATPAPQAAAPAPAAEPEKKAEAPATPAPAAQPEQVAQAAAPAAPAPAASSDAVPNPDDPNSPPPGSRKPNGDAVYPNPVSDFAKTLPGVSWQDARYRNKDGDPVPVVTKDYMVDWGTWNGFRRYHDACHVCHGPNALGSTFAPASGRFSEDDGLQHIRRDSLESARQVNRGGTEFVMPSFGEDKNIMCYIDDIYTYIKARSTGAMPPGRPNGREDISPDAKKAADDCTG